MEGCAKKRETEEENLLLFNMMKLTEGENAFLGAGFP
jgi:hypothetical protein